MYLCGVYCSQTQLPHYFIMGSVLEIYIKVLMNVPSPQKL